MGLALKLEGFIYYVYKQSSVLTEIIQENHSYISIYYNLFQKKGIARLLKKITISFNAKNNILNIGNHW